MTWLKDMTNLIQLSLLKGHDDLSHQSMYRDVTILYLH